MDELQLGISTVRHVREYTNTAWQTRNIESELLYNGLQDTTIHSRMFTLVFCFLCLLSFNYSKTFAQGVQEKAESKYLIFLHGRILEEMPVKPVSPEFGPYDFEGIVKAFRDAG